MSRIFWDTNLFIYLFEGSGSHGQRVKHLRRSMVARGDQLLTSTLTLGEVLVKPTERRDDALARKYQEAIMGAAVVLPFDIKAAKLYAALRTDRSLRLPTRSSLRAPPQRGWTYS